MSLAVTWRLPTNGQAFQYPLPRLIKAFVLQNLSGSAITISTNSGDAITIPSGATQTITLTSGASTFTTQTSANTTGEAWLYGYDDPADVSQNQFLGTQNVNITNASLTVNGAITATISGPVSITGTVNISGTIQDLIVESNTTTLLGLLPSHIDTFTLSSLGSHVTSIPAAAAGFGITATMQGAGRLNLFLTVSGNVAPLLRNMMFFFGPNAGLPLEKRFAIPMPAGATLTTQWDDATTNVACIIRW